MPAMRKGGSIVLAPSAAAQTGLANHEAVAAAKGGVISLVRSAAATYGARGVRVDAVGAAIAWLLDPATSWVTGQVLGVDGGLGQIHPRPKG